MINKRELRDFFKSDIEPYISTIEDDIKLEKNLFKMMIGIFIFLGLLIFLISHKFNTYVGGIYIDDFLSKFIFLVPIGIYAVYYLIQKSNELDIDKSYEKVVIEPLIKKLDLSLKYDRYNGINEYDFKRSELFKNYDKYSSTRLFSGFKDGKPIEFSNVKITRKDSDHENIDIFNGMFIKVKMKKNIKGKVILRRDLAEKAFGILGRGLQLSSYKKYKKVILDNSKFEKEFVVYADDEIEARYILNHSKMEKITEVSQRLNKKHNYLNISFVDDNIFLAIENFGFLDRNSAMNATRSSVIDFEHLEYHLEMLDLALSLSEELNLESVV